jgi:hypothetical protein
VLFDGAPTKLEQGRAQYGEIADQLERRELAFLQGAVATA